MAADEPLSAPVDAQSINEEVFPIVGIGASAGGLEALRQLLGALPLDTGMGFVIVQHLSPEHASSLVEILSRATSMPVCEVRDEQAVEANHGYCIPPGCDLRIEKGKLRLFKQERTARHRGIDQFFRSLAENSGHLAIGIVLSGGASDGTLGLEEIKAAGGITFAQDESAQHESMPRSAVESGCVDFVLSPEKIAGELARIARHPYIAGQENTESAEPEHARIAQLVRRATGVDFTHYRASTLGRRISRRMLLHKLETLGAYEDYVRKTPAEAEALYNDVLINVTSFFRNPDAFAVLAETIFPAIFAERSMNDPVRVWSLGCSTGEEAYSIAIVFTECAAAAGSSAQLQLFATDLKEAGVAKARAGLYPRSIAADVSPERLQRFFAEEEGGYRICKGIRERCVFSRHNIVTDPPFSRVDLISCRNLLIYLEPVLQQQILPLLHYALKPGGHLWLGGSETVGASRALFECENSRHKIFARKPGPPAQRRAPLDSPLAAGGRPFSGTLPMPRETLQAELNRGADRLLLARYAPPGVIITAGLEILQFRGDTGPYLAPAPGAASHSLLKMLREGLLVAVRAVIERAGEEGRAVREEGLRVKSDGGFRELAVEAIPIKSGLGKGFVVLFDEGSTPVRAEIPNPKSAAREDADEVARLRAELAATREYLQSVIEAQEAANEELQSANEEAQSANEELQSVNEELETSKEEIQSASEELATVNDELNNRNLELNQLSNDLTNIYVSARLPMLILGRDLRIRRFTPAAEKTLGLAGGDIGRPLGETKLSVVIAGLVPLLREVIDTVTPRECDVQDAQGRWFLLRARPYQTHEKKIDGAVVTLIDIDDLRRAHELAEALLAHAPVPVLVLDERLRVKSASRAFFKTFQVTPEATLNRPIYELGDHQWDTPALRRLLENVLPHSREVHDFEVRHDFEGVGPRVMLLNARRLAQEEDCEPLIVLTIEDTTAQIRAEEDSAAELAALRVLQAFSAWLLREDDIGELYRRIAETASIIMRADMASMQMIDEAESELSLLAWKGFAPESATHWEKVKLGSSTSCGAAAASTERVIVADVEKCAFLAGSADLVEFRRSGIRACQSTPLISRGGKLLGTVSTHWRQPHEPAERELRLLDLLARQAADLIERTQSEAALRTSESRFRVLFDLGPVAIFSCDRTGAIQNYNRRATELWGREPLLGEGGERHWGPLKLFHRDGRPLPHEESPILEVLRTGEMVEDAEVIVERPDGSRIAVSVTFAPLKDEAGEVQGAIIAFYDITERWELEDSLVARALELARADRSKDEFLAMLAHELRNPMAPLSNAAELLQTADATDKDREEAKRIIIRQIKSMTRIIDDLLDVSRITEGKVELRKEQVALGTILTSVANLVRSTCAARHQKLTVTLPSETIFLEADATRLEQVFTNLLGNASKYSGDASQISLSAERDAAVEPPQAIVRVRDNGAGIDPEVLPRIFDLFVQATRALDRAHGGLGIGLTLVRRLVGLHGGSVEARSEGLGHGAEFIVRLPILRDALALAPAPLPPVTRETPRRILIVDDNTDSARSLATLQTRRGHDVRSAGDGPTALTIAAEFLPEVVLLDIGLPGMDGYEVARRLHAMPALRDTFLVAMTGYGSAEDRLTARQAGIDEHLVKPVSLEILRGWLNDPARFPGVLSRE